MRIRRDGRDENKKRGDGWELEERGGMIIRREQRDKEKKRMEGWSNKKRGEG